MWEPVSPCPGVAQVKTRVNRSGWVTVSEQCNHILMLLGGYQIQGPGEDQVGPETRGPGEVQMGTTFTRSREAMLRIRVTSYR